MATKSNAVEKSVAALAGEYRRAKEILDAAREAFESYQSSAARAEAVLIRALLGAGSPCVLDGSTVFRVLRGTPVPRLESFDVIDAAGVPLCDDVLDRTHS